jgi:IclR family pca regulon transcriptional regulator
MRTSVYDAHSSLPGDRRGVNGTSTNGVAMTEHHKGPGRGERRDHVQSVDRAFAVLRCFGADTPALSLADVAARTDLDRAAARRYLLTLERIGYVGHSGQRFYLRPRILELGYAYLSSLTLPQLAQPHLAALAQALQESCAITVLDRTDIVYVAVVNATRGLSITLTVGNRLPAYCTAMGRVLLSALDDQQLRKLLDQSDHPRHTENTVFDTEQIVGIVEQTRRAGWAVVDQELESGVRSVAVPVRDGAGVIVAAASVSVPASRIPMSQMRNQIRRTLTSRVAELEGHLI